MNAVTFGWKWPSKTGKTQNPDPPPRVYGPEDLQKTIKSAERITMDNYGVYDSEARFSAAQVLLLRDLNKNVAQIMSQQGPSKP